MAHAIKNLIIIMTFLVLSILQTAAQNQKTTFSSVNQVGLLTGSKGSFFMVQTINGIKKDKWSAGAGTGFDFYKERTVPLFIDIRRDFSAKRNTPFAYADAGLNFLWLTEIQKAQTQFLTTSPGLYYDFGIGWKLAGKNNGGFLISAGYSFKQVKEKVRNVIWNPVPQTSIETYDRYNYLYKRIVIKVGFML